MHIQPFDRLVTLYLARPLRSVFPASPSGATVLMYHSVSETDSVSRSTYFQTNTKPEIFRNHMSILSGGPYEVVPLSEIFQPTAESCKQRVAITFDDGYLDFLEHAHPVLRTHGFHSTMFVPTKHVGESFNGRRMLSWNEIRLLLADDVEFGSHTHSHPRLHGMTAVEIDKEIGLSTKELENRLGRPATVFSYPYAFPQEDRAFKEQLDGILERNGIRIGVTTQIGYSTPDTHPRFIPRIPICSHDDPDFFRAKIGRCYAWLSPFQSAKKVLFGTPRTSRGGAAA